jgi:hypothetical protein
MLPPVDALLCLTPLDARVRVALPAPLSPPCVARGGVLLLGVSGCRVSADPAPLLASRWPRVHSTRLLRLLPHVSATPLRPSADAFCPPPPPLFPCPPGGGGCCKQASRKRPPPPNQLCPGVHRLMALPTDLTSPPARSHRAPILELFGMGPLKTSSVVTAAVV